MVIAITKNSSKQYLSFEANVDGSHSELNSFGQYTLTGNGSTEFEALNNLKMQAQKLSNELLALIKEINSNHIEK